jgi:hypothetical protein
MGMRTAILHIGTEKTGTTTIQAFLAANRDKLTEIGFAFPHSCGVQDSRGLVMYAMRPGRHEEIHIAAGLTTEAARREAAQRLEEELAAELDTLLPEVRAVIFSSESFHSRLCHRDELERLRALLLRHFGRIRIVVYLRRQDQVAVSLYSTTLRGGQTRWEVLPWSNESDGYYNYELLLDRWSDVFSPDAICPRLFSVPDLITGDLVTDFCSACGIGDPSGLALPARQNQSFQPAAQEFLRQMNAYFPIWDGNEANPRRGPLGTWIASEFPGAGRVPSRPEVREFLSRFAASNDRVRERWFPERKTLFDDDLSSYPEQADDRFTFEDAVRVAAALWQRSAGEMDMLKAEVRRLEAELAFKAGRIAQMKGHRRKAEEKFRMALELDPEHPRAPHQLVRLTGQHHPRAARTVTRRFDRLFRLWR